MFTATKIVAISGLTRDQLNQANSRLGFGPAVLGEQPENGAARTYSRGTALFYVVVSRLRSMGMKWDDIRHVLIQDAVVFQHFFGGPDLQGDDTFKSWVEAEDAESGPALLAVFRGATGPDGIQLKIDGIIQSGLRASLCYASHLTDWLADPATAEPTAIVVHLGDAIKRVSEAA